MPSPFAAAAASVGGSAHEFRQADYIRMNGWGADDPKDRQGALQSGHGLKGGVCMAVSALYLASRGDWSVFSNTLASPGGLAHARGLMNLQNEAIRADLIRYSDESGFSFVRSCLEVLGLRYSGQQRYGETRDVGDGVVGFVRQNGCYLLGFRWGLGSHATAIIREDGGYKAFDPEFGGVTLPDGTAFATFVTGWLAPNYPGIRRWFIQRYYV